MKLLSLSKKIILFIFLLFFLTSVSSEDSVDIWNKKNLNNNEDASPTKQLEKNKSISNIQLTNKKNDINEIQIDSALNENNNDLLLYGIFDPEENNFKLNMWENSEGSKIKDVLDRINKIKLSPFAEEIFINTIFTYSNSPPKKMSEEKFLGYKLNWLINNQKDELLKTFLNKNKEFPHKTKVIKYLVDKSISNAKIKDGCKNINFISKEIKDSYLEQFKILCLILDNKKNQAFLLLDILREQNLSNKFFDTHINSLLGINSKNLKISDKNLLNFYLSSITVPNFSYEPNEKTDKFIWEYLNAANLIKLDDDRDKEKLKNLENAANENRFDKQKIFNIYSNINFDLNSLINAENIYQTFDSIDARALIYQKYLLSDNEENKVKLLFLLKDLFRKDSLSNIYVKILSDRLKEINLENISESYQEVVQKNILSEDEFRQGKIKYDDKILHRSKVIKYFQNETDQKKAQKDFIKIYKKIKKNRKYFFSAKDLALVESLAKDGFSIPKELDYKEISKQYSIPSNLQKLGKSNESAFLTLKLVEIIGEDEAYNLDPETIYFITYLLNQNNLKKIRNEILISALPLRS